MCQTIIYIHHLLITENTTAMSHLKITDISLRVTRPNVTSLTLILKLRSSVVSFQETHERTADICGHAKNCIQINLKILQRNSRPKSKVRRSLCLFPPKSQILNGMTCRATIKNLTLWRRNFFLILAHPVYKMWIIQEPNKLALWNKLHFEEKKTESIEHV